MNDNVNNPKHYTSHPSGVECIEIAEMLPFNLGNALKYLWRAGKKLDEVEDIKKAVFYLRRQANSEMAIQLTFKKKRIYFINEMLVVLEKTDVELYRKVLKICYGTRQTFLELADELEIKYGLK